MTGYQYETMEWSFMAPAPAGSHAAADLLLTVSLPGGDKTVRGFYAGNGCYKVRFLPEEVGSFEYRVSGAACESGTIAVEPAREGFHGPVRAEGIHLYHADGTPFYSFGTTVYALAHQSDALMDETIASLNASPFNKVRMCVFPKHYDYNHNEPQLYAFEKDADGAWDPAHPCFAFWDAFEGRMKQLFEAGIQVDLIVFHPYDRWGFSTMPQEKNLIYLDYLTRRFAAFPNIWWSMANEYDLVAGRSMEEWYELEEYVAAHDPYHHLLSSHNCFKVYDFERENVTHVSWQTKQLSRIPEMMERYGKPVLIDECCYEGNLPQGWGAISGREMTARFWRTTAVGGFCTHGETFLPGEDEVVWWARGGKLVGESPARIAFLREIIESLPGPLSPVPSRISEVFRRSAEDPEAFWKSVPEKMHGFLKAMLRMDLVEASRFDAGESHYCGHCGDDAFLYYYDVQTFSSAVLALPETKTYRVEVIDTWNMTRETVLTGAKASVEVKLPGREYMAVLAVAE